MYTYDVFNKSMMLNCPCRYFSRLKEDLKKALFKWALFKFWSNLFCSHKPMGKTLQMASKGKTYTRKSLRFNFSKS